MIRIATLSCFVVLSAAQVASAGLWDAMTVSYPTAHVHASSEYMAACGAAGCNSCNSCGRHSHVCHHPSAGCCGDLWSSYCTDLSVGDCRPKLHTRYHWFAKPSCGCGVQTTMPCCGDYPMCGCNHGMPVKGCGSACTSCLGMHVRGMWNKCRSYGQCGCGSTGCDSCGGATEIINLEQEMQHSVPEIAPAIEPTPAAKEARLMPSLQALLPLN